MYPDSLKNLIESFKYLPGIGEKTAERLAFAVLEFDEDQCELFSQSLLDVKSKIKKCSICNTLTENDVCFVCSNNLRDNEILCVVDDTKSVFLFEKLGMFNGYYHVLDGLISPLDGVNPEDIGLNKLIERISKDKFKEIILAFKPSIEGETTALYIKKILSDMDVVVSRLASGLPIGADMEYVDKLTLERALIDRKEIE
ncbi:MAG: recombination mediator RecR [Bacilli bacterium]|nr:recombination mediator RecR [Mycoplasmatota bacterium]MDD6941194.1 recombination mediator RecR [bacterium]MDY2697215.1 recombination mediator RecR [Bacilli bacterium]MDY5992907.1 recombination mediator RecR [Bacilli bacterium]MEE0014689.1 recombination mediator RecR [Bacilli bacterium]